MAIMQQTLLSELSAKTAKLPAAEETGVVWPLELVDPHGSRLELSRDALRAVEVRGVYRGAESGVV